MMGTEHGYFWYISTNVRLGQNPHRAVHIANAVQRSKANTEQGLSAGTYAADKTNLSNMQHVVLKASPHVQLCHAVLTNNQKPWTRRLNKIPIFVSSLLSYRSA